MKLIWLLFIWQPHEHFMMPVTWFPDHASCAIEAKRINHGQMPPQTACGAVRNELPQEFKK